MFDFDQFFQVQTSLAFKYLCLKHDQLQIAIYLSKIKQNYNSKMIYKDSIACDLIISET